MSRFRKRPPEVEAIQWTGENGVEILKFAEEKNAVGHLELDIINNKLFAIYPYGLVDILDYILWDEDSQKIEVWSKRQFENKYEPIIEQITDVGCRACLGTGVIDQGNGNGSTCIYCFGTGGISVV